MFDILNSNKEYKLTVRFSKEGVGKDELLNSLLASIESGEVLNISSELDEIVKVMTADEARKATDDSVGALVMSMTNMELNHMSENRDLDTDPNEPEVESDEE